MPNSSKIVVLVVEDEPLILMDVMQSSQDAGFDVVDAVTPSMRLIRLNERPDIKAVFTDVNMPGCFDGVQLACMVNKRRPDVVILVTSGTVKVQQADLPGAGQFIPKPYRRRACRQAHRRTDRVRSLA